MAFILSYNFENNFEGVGTANRKLLVQLLLLVYYNLLVAAGRLNYNANKLTIKISKTGNKFSRHIIILKSKVIDII